MDLRGLSATLAADVESRASTGTMLRAVRQFIMDSDRASELGDDIATRPPGTGDERWDALIAGVVEDLAFRHDLSTPAWVRDPDLHLEEWWFLTRFVGLHPVALAETPPAIANHGVFVRRASLQNV